MVKLNNVFKLWKAHQSGMDTHSALLENINSPLKGIDAHPLNNWCNTELWKVRYQQYSICWDKKSRQRKLNISLADKNNTSSLPELKENRL